MAHRSRFTVTLQELPHEGSSISLDNQNLHHLRDVLRASAGTEISVFDRTSNRELSCVISAIDSSSATARIERIAPRRPVSPLTLIIGRPKNSTLDFVIEKSTELGATKIIIFDAEYSQGRQPINSDRLNRIVESAFNQSNSSAPPAIQTAPNLSSALPAQTGLKLLLTPSAQLSITDATLGFFKRTPETQRRLEDRTDCAELFLIVGPEGGLSEGEEEFARTQGYVPVTLSENILRTETAALVGVALVQLLRR